MIKIITITISLFSCLFSQFIDVQITYEYNDRIIGNDKTYILEEFNSSIENYYKTTSFSNEYDYLDIPLKIHFIFERINFIGEHEFDQIAFQMLITNNADQYFYAKNVSFPYSKGQYIYYNPTTFNPLTSFFDYYAYLFIATELDTYDLFLGGAYYQKCLDLYSLSKSSRDASSIWSSFKDDIEEIKDNEFLRIARYNFYFCIDMLNQDEINTDFMKEKMHDFLDNIILIRDKFGYDKNTLKFLNAFHIEIADLFKTFSMKEGLEFLSKFDNNNKQIYLDYLDND